VQFRSGIRRAFQTGGYAAFFSMSVSCSVCIPGNRRDAIERQSPFETQVRTSSKTWASRSVRRICLFAHRFASFSGNGRDIPMQRGRSPRFDILSKFVFAEVQADKSIQVRQDRTESGRLARRIRNVTEDRFTTTGAQRPADLR
jgi:hypothetical protein